MVDKCCRKLKNLHCHRDAHSTYTCLPPPTPHLFKLSINLPLAVQKPNPHLPNVPSYPRAIRLATPVCTPLKWVIF